MKKFKYKRKCPQCNQHDIVNTFVKKSRFYISLETSAVIANRDLINRRCENCSYTWNERVK